jgi:hypothetical protein
MSRLSANFADRRKSHPADVAPYDSPLVSVYMNQQLRVLAPSLLQNVNV